MPRSKSGMKRKPVAKEDIEKALELILENKSTVYGAAKTMNLSKTTLLRHLKEFKESGLEKYSYNKNNDVKKVFSEEEEHLLVNYIRKAAQLHYGLTLRDVKVLAYQFAKLNAKQYDKSWDTNQMAGKFWLRSFRKKYAKELSLRRPEATSLARSTAFNKANVDLFFNNYKQVLEKHPAIAAHNIWNCDETGISTVHVPPKILAPKGVKQIGSMTSAERGTNITMICAINAGGGFIPPMLIFPRVNFKDFMLKGAPVGSIGGANPSGWSNEDLFYQFLLHFLQHTKSSKENPTILLLDNHESHISVKSIQLSKDNGASLVTFVPHTSHKMQPLDRGVFGPFKTYYNTAMQEWMLRSGNVGKPATIYDVAELVGKSFPLAFTPANIIHGFKVSGIEPFNTNIFKDYEFLPSNVTDRPLDSAEGLPNIINQTSVCQQESTSFSAINLQCQPSTSSLGLTNLEASPQLSVVSPEAIRPYPKAEARKNTRKGRPKGKSCVLTDTPVKAKIEEQEALKQAKKQKIDKAVKRKPKINTIKKLVFSFDSDEEEEVEDLCDDIGYSDEDFAELLDPDNDIIGVGSFILVKIATKKTVKYFVAEVAGIKDEFYEVQYLKKDKNCSKFTREDDTIYQVDKADIHFKLPHPILSGGSARQLEKLTFGVNLAQFNIE